MIASDPLAQSRESSGSSAVSCCRARPGPLGPARALSDPRSRSRDRAEVVRGRRWLRGQPVRGRPLDRQAAPDQFRSAGRLWIASSEVYPQIKPGAVANDKVLIVEDRDHDGRADTTTVFARGLLIPTGIEPGDGGAYVANSTELLHFKDTDGDGKADATRVVLSGFGTEDTHHILHTLRWGYDGMLYFNQSIYIHSHIETPHGVRRLGEEGSGSSGPRRWSSRSSSAGW